MTFHDYINEVEHDLRSVLMTLIECVKKISKAVKSVDIGKAGSKAGSRNIYGEEQLALDVYSDQLIQNECKNNPVIGLLASEELPDVVALGDFEYAVAYDPLDGSSLIDVNLAVGTIFGIYRAPSFIGRKGNEMIASMFAQYGPRTTVVLTLGSGVNEFTLDFDGKFILTRENIRITNDKKMFAPGNLRACKFDQNYIRLMEYYMKEQYTLRYSGGMVPDINQILLKGRGIFTYPAYQDAPNGKLRLLFECAPMAMLVEQAGGMATNGSERILDIEIKELSQRTPIFIGAKEEVELAERFLRR